MRGCFSRRYRLGGKVFFKYSSREEVLCVDIGDLRIDEKYMEYIHHH